jgi:hypothetical protein
MKRGRKTEKERERGAETKDIESERAALEALTVSASWCPPLSASGGGDATTL